MIILGLLIVYGFLISRFISIVKPKRRWVPLKEASFEILRTLRENERLTDEEKQAILLFNSKIIFVSSVLFLFFFIILLLPFIFCITFLKYNTISFHLLSIILTSVGFFLGYLYDKQIR